jgi:hypothetical protein
MHDRPTADELLASLEHWLAEQMVPSLDGARQYEARVASNIVRTLRRELEGEESALDAEWRGLDALLGVAERPPSLAATKDAIRERTDALCARIRAGDADAGAFHDAVVAHVRETVRAKLLAANPGWIDG